MYVYPVVTSKCYQKAVLVVIKTSTKKLGVNEMIYLNFKIMLELLYFHSYENVISRL